MLIKRFFVCCSTENFEKLKGPNILSGVGCILEFACDVINLAMSHRTRALRHRLNYLDKIYVKHCIEECTDMSWRFLLRPFNLRSLSQNPLVKCQN